MSGIINLCLMQTTIIIPCYNESSRLNQDAFLQYAEMHPDVYFLFVNDGSKDNTLEVLKKLSEKHSQISFLDVQPNGGKAEAVRKGMLYAVENCRADFVGFWDADLATPLFEIDNFINQIQYANFDMVTGLRLMRLGAGVQRSIMRHHLGRCFATVASYILDLPVYDSQCGSKLYRANVVSLLFEKKFISKWLFDVELLARYVKVFGHNSAVSKIYEYPLLEWEDVRGSKLRFKDFFKAPYELLIIKRKYR